MKRLIPPLLVAGLPLLAGVLVVSASGSAARADSGEQATVPEATVPEAAVPEATVPEGAVPEGATLFVELKCSNCHSIASQGIEAKMKSERMRGPDLSDVGNQVDADWLRGWLKKKESLHGKKHKGQFKGSDEELTQLIDWLLTLEET